MNSSNDGIFNCNKNINRVGPLVTVDELKKVYLFGIDIIADNGQALPDEAYQKYIDNAVSLLEHDLDISIFEREETEFRDYSYNEYMDWGYMQLNNFPVIEIDSIDMVYFRDQDGNPESVQTIPKSWIRLQKHDGIIRFVPNNKFAANLQVSGTGAFFPEILRSTTVPHLWRIIYRHGFEAGKIPAAINQAVASLAAIQALSIAGNLVIGAGIASQSISLDGLSQSINTTSSAENSAYSATLKEYQVNLFGKTLNDPNSLMRKLRDFYKGQAFDLL